MDADLRARIDKHLETCEICSAVLDSTRNVVVLVADDRVFELPAGFSKRLHERIDEELERRQVERVRSLRARRDSVRWAAALRRVADHARSGENLMPAILEAVESNCTVGEIAGGLRQVFGEYQERVVV